MDDEYDRQCAALVPPSLERFLRCDNCFAPLQSGAPYFRIIPAQIFACPSAELLRDVAGDEPGALGATAHGAIAAKMCRHIGGYSDLLAHFRPAVDTKGKVA